MDLLSVVAPRVGAWIETARWKRLYLSGVKSHPVWVRGLKLVMGKPIRVIHEGRTPCGCVD